MSELKEQPISCPYCGERVTILVDDSLPEQSYVEDCHVCCRPIVLNVTADPDDGVYVVATPEND